MEVVKNIQNLQDRISAVITVGNFDGVHQGHRAIIDPLVAEAKRLNVKSVLMTFAPSSKEFFAKEKDIKLITTIDEKQKLFSDLGIDILIIQKFDSEFSKLSSNDFIEQILLKKIDVKECILGSTHTFGNNNNGNFKSLNELGKKHNFDIKVVDIVKKNGYNTSSTNLRTLLATGEIDNANKILGREYSIRGQVISGKQIGRNLGFPTVNLKPISAKKLIPKVGVYCVEISDENNRYNGMCNIGYNPTFNGNRLSIEINIINREFQSIGNDEIELKFYSRIRDEEKFKNEEELIEQLKRDKENCEKYFINKKNQISRYSEKRRLNDNIN
ncbi:MAG: bifunctional riboflavin kinase/FAD synthetase [Candidatus Marinimicrobia bacterium]|nr:bifunctional riboflavin kinase/FAD synthetase [Candidatus Neomarinimicrobiota bacterium]